MNKKFIIAYFICVSPFFVIAQDIAGFWKGTLDMFNGCFTNNNIELQITLKGDSIYGNSYHYLDVNNYVKKKFTGFYDAEAKKIFLQEGVVTTYKIPSQCKVCIKKYELLYSSNANQESLKGDWSSVVTGNYINCESGAITLSRIRESAFKDIPEIIVDTGEIRLDFYDNGEIDDDSISVRVNDKTVLTHQKLGAEPITTLIRMDVTNTFQEVEMIAENVGTIPPNTALLVITAGKKRYELFLTSSNQKSAKVRFLYEKDN
ncbi:hypothetical protein [Segetibacter koreensis]|uniref:hypothetical protein n=1 Tax=Segetibacter koreensis TaxID=398037 RepID=UPI000378DFBF|nr:hypothetical protein [Segetibacter koreensis]